MLYGHRDVLAGARMAPIERSFIDGNERTGYEEKSAYLAAAVLVWPLRSRPLVWLAARDEIGPLATALQILAPLSIPQQERDSRSWGSGLQLSRRPGNPHVAFAGRPFRRDHVCIVKSFVDGWIRDAQGATTGSIVSRNRVLATFYSPELLSAQQSYFYSISATGRSEDGGRGAAQQQVTKSARQYEDNLRNLGMSDTQIEEIGDRCSKSIKPTSAP
jgi:hypothetical protein